MIPRTSAVYGSGIGFDTLANTQIGGTSCGCPNLESSFRFRAGHSSTLASIRIYLITDREGYSAGSGGTVVIRVEEDDGTPQHRPSGRMIASAIAPLETFPIVSFADPASLQAGSLYHIVFRNADRQPTVNFVSVNSLFVELPDHPRQPQHSDIDWAQLLDYGTGWAIRPEYTPILQLQYGDGAIEGVGYMESWVAAAKVITGSTRVRETFVVAGGDVAVSTISVRLARLSGAGRLTARLETSGGEIVAEGSAPPPPPVRPATPTDESGSAWITIALADTVTLHDGEGYNLMFSTDTSTRYRIHGIRKGESVGFAAPTYFPDGYAEVDDGSGWVALDPGWRGPLAEADLQFYLR